MPSIISSTLSALFGKPAYRVLFLGLDASGRTTCLYLLKLNQIVTTIPTIGFNVEDMEVDGKKLTVWDVGGCDKIRPLWRHYFQNTQGVVFFVDSSDRERLQMAREELHMLACEEELRTKPVLVMASKQDLPGAMSPREVREAMQLDGAWAEGRDVTCMPSSSSNKQSMVQAMQWLVAAMSKRSTSAVEPASSAPASAAAAVVKAKMHSQGTAEDVEGVLERWLQAEDAPNNEFLAAFSDFTLDSWDHRTHLRIAWLMLTRHGRKEGMERIFSGIRAFIENSQRTKRGSGSGTTFHETMTYFWAHMVHWGIVATKNPRGDFKTFLLLNPQLANGGMFLHYYSKQLMLMSAEARTQVVLPDKRPLPSLLSDMRRVNKSATPVAITAMRNGPVMDIEFLSCFEARQLPNWGHQVMLRVLYCYLGSLGRSSTAVDHILKVMQANEKQGFNCTITYFWIQMLTASLMPVYHAVLFPQKHPDAGCSLTSTTNIFTSTVSAIFTGPSGLRPDAMHDSFASMQLQSALAVLESNQLPIPGSSDAAGTRSADRTGSADRGTGMSDSATPPSVLSGSSPPPTGLAPRLPEFCIMLAGGCGQASRALAKLGANPCMYLRHYSKHLIYSEGAAEAFVVPDKKQLPRVV